MKKLTEKQAKIIKGSAIVLGLGALGAGIYFGIKAYKKQKIEKSTTDELLDSIVATPITSLTTSEEVKARQTELNEMLKRYYPEIALLTVDGIKGAKTLEAEKLAAIRKTKMDLAKGTETGYKTELEEGDINSETAQTSVTDNWLKDFVPTWFK